MARASNCAERHVPGPALKEILGQHLCGDHIAAIVLERLTYWWGRGTRIVHGIEWRAKPRNQLMEETRVTEMQLRRALAILKAKSLIETSQHRFASSVGPVMHYRLLPRAMVLMQRVSEGPEATPVLGMENQHLDHMAVIGTRYTYDTPKGVSPVYPVSEEVPEEGISGKDCEGVVMDKGLPKKGHLNASAKPPNLKLGMSAADLIAHKSKTGVFPGTKAKKGRVPLAEVWREAYASTGHFR